MSRGPGRFLRRLASLLVRGPHAPFVLGDLEETLRRDLARGVGPRRARWRRAHVVLHEAHRPVVPGLSVLLLLPLLACTGAIVRALRVVPTEAMRAEG